MTRLPSGSLTQLAHGSQSDQVAEVIALQKRAITGALTAVAITGDAAAFDFWRGYYKALDNLRWGVGTNAAFIDEATSGYQPPRCIEAAWARLAEDPKDLSARHVLQVLAAEGIKASADHFAELHVVGREVAEHGPEAAFSDVDHEHAAAGIDGNDGSTHATTLAQEGGPA